MLSFWKYITALEFDDDLALHHLLAAHNEVTSDSSLPRWSIYRTLIPRRVSEEIFDEAFDLFSNNGVAANASIWRRSQVAVDVRDALIRALRLALVAYRAQDETWESRRTGDLLFGYKKGDRYYNSELIAKISRFYLQLFRSESFNEDLLKSKELRSLGFSFDFLRRCVQKNHQVFQRFGASDEQQEAAKAYDEMIDLLKTELKSDRGKP